MFVYTRPNDLINPMNDGGLSIVVGASKSAIEDILGPMTQEEYEKHIHEKSIPKNAINTRPIQLSDLPADREFRNAWCDVTPESTVDIDLEKAKDIKLSELRKKRDEELLKTDSEFVQAFSSDDQAGLEKIKKKKQKLREMTDSLKSLKVNGYNDVSVLNKIRELGKFEKV